MFDGGQLVNDLLVDLLLDGVLVKSQEPLISRLFFLEYLDLFSFLSFLGIFVFFLITAIKPMEPVILEDLGDAHSVLLLDINDFKFLIILIIKDQPRRS